MSYRRYIDDLETYLSDVLPTVDEIILMGDLNINMAEPDSCRAIAFRDMLESFGLIQIINSPTRMTATTASILDLIIVSDADLVESSGVFPVGNISDHNMVSCRLSLPSKNKVKHQWRRSFKSFSMELFLEDLYRVPFFSVFDLRDVDSKADFLTSNICDVLQSHAPVRQIKIGKPLSPWITDNIKLMQQDKTRPLKSIRKQEI